MGPPRARLFAWREETGRARVASRITAKRCDRRAHHRRFFEDGSSQALLLTTTVSFVHYDANGYRPYSPPDPPVAATVPYDVWYPFQVDSSSAAAPRAPRLGGGGGAAAARLLLPLLVAVAIAAAAAPW